MVKKLAQLISNLFCFLVGILAVFVLAYRFGWMLMKGYIGWGNDLPFALSYVYYLERWLPHSPRWHYEWAGGMPFLQNYPLLMTYLTSFFHHLSGLTIVQLGRLFSWLAIPLAGVTIVIFARLIFKNWILAILAGLFFVLSPDSWIWTVVGGFYAAPASFPFMVATFIFFELAWQKEKRIWWLLAVVFCGLTWLTHPITAATMTIGLGVYGLGLGLQEKKFSLGIIRPLLVALAGFLLVAFWTFPFVLSRAAWVGVAPHQVVYVTFKEVLGLAAPHPGASYITSDFFSGAVLFLAALGLFFSLIRRSKLWISIACALAGFFFMIGPGIFPWLLKGPLLTLWALINVRAGVLPRLFLPIIAAYGVVSLGESPFHLIAKLWKGLRENLPWQLATRMVGGAVAFVVVYLVFKQIVIIPPNLVAGNVYLGYGPLYHWLDVRRVDGQWRISEGRKPLFVSVQESLRRLVTFDIEVDDVPLREAAYLPEFAKKAGLSSHDRIDVSPLSGSVIATWNAATDVSQVVPYVGTSLIPRMVGYQQACFHNYAGDFICLKNEIQSLAKWWGLKLVYIGEVGFTEEKVRTTNRGVLDNLRLGGFQEKRIELESGRTILFYEIPEPAGLASLSNKPLVLVIGNNPPYNDGFSTVFRSFSRFGFGYDRALLVPGKGFIDDYKLQELKKYPLIVLYGHQYHNNNKAWSILSQYVKEGGSLFVETGWQYWSQDWGKIDEKGQSLTIELPEILPVSRAKWGEIGTYWRDLKVDSSLLGREVSSQGWADLVWENNPWGMSLAEPGDLRGFGRALVTTSGKLIVAGGHYGKGRIVWSGMNLFGHTSYNESESENEFLLAVFSWLTSLDQVQEKELNFERITPDEVVIQIDKTLKGERKVMFKEVMAPGWEAFLTTNGRKEKLPILKVGLGWKLVLLPEDFSTGSLTFTYKPTTKDWLFISITILTGLGMIVYWLDGILKGAILGKSHFDETGGNFLTKKLHSWREKWESEEA